MDIETEIEETTQKIQTELYVTHPQVIYTSRVLNDFINLSELKKITEKESNEKLDEEFTIQEFVSIILKDKKGKIWLAKRINKEKPLYGKYSCPGGKMEENETQEQACSRELLEETNLTIKENDKSLKYIQTNEYSDNRDGYVNTKRIVHLYELEHSGNPVNTEPQNHEGWRKFILGEIIEKEIIDSVQKYIEWTFFKPQYHYIKTPYQCIRDPEYDMTNEFIKEKEEEHPSFFMIRIINQTLEISNIKTKNFKYESSKDTKNQIVFFERNYPIITKREFCIFYKIPQEIKFIAGILPLKKSSQKIVTRIPELMIRILFFMENDETEEFLKTDKTSWTYFTNGMINIKEEIQTETGLIYKNSTSSFEYIECS